MKFRTVILSPDECRKLNQALDYVSYRDQIERTMSKRKTRGGNYRVRFERRYTEVMVEALEIEFPGLKRDPPLKASGTETGRFSSKRPNYTNVPRPAPGPPLLRGQPGPPLFNTQILVWPPLVVEGCERRLRDKLQPRHALERLAVEG